MIGLPTETEEDLRGILELAKKVQEQAPAGTKRLQVTAAISPFVPKPHTPFQWEAQISMVRAKNVLSGDYYRGRQRLSARSGEAARTLSAGLPLDHGRHKRAPRVGKARLDGWRFLEVTADRRRSGYP